MMFKGQGMLNGQETMLKRQDMMLKKRETLPKG
jgi:hypothetical protein